MGAARAASVVDPGGSPKPCFAKSSKLRGCTILASQSIGAARRRHDRSRTGGRSRPRWRRSNDLDWVNGNLVGYRRTVKKLIPRSNSLFGRENSLFGKNNSLFRQKNSLFHLLGNFAASI